MYVVSTILPPLLPTVFTVSVGISDHRLTQKRVACTSPESILVAGKVTRAFFDKTGTLTKQGLDFMSVRSSSKWDKATFVSTEMTAGMAVCNSLTQSKDSGELVGNPVDCVMFEASGAKMAAQAITDGNGNKLDVVKHFDFDHHRMTQSVIVRNPDNSLMAYVKGSGENIKKLCSTTTIPANFDAALRDSASQGIYQISMARKPMSPDTDLSSITREEVESALAFLGVINFKNSMRADSPSVIQQLREGEVRSIMITGDSILTGICIAKESGILGKDSPVLVGNLYDDRTIVWVTESDAECELPSVDTLKASGTKLAISGAAFSVLCLADAAKARHLMELIRVYGRCNPHDKVAVVSSFVNAGFITMMCGDGGNDCGALKAAHVGVALSDAEASTVAPFTSLDKSISSVVEVLKEGRCALASALASYKYMIMYGQMETLIQMMSAYFALLLSEWCWVFMDGIWTISLAFALPLARPAKKLAPSRPTASILGLQTVSSVLGVLLLNFVFIVGALGYLWNQEWFQCRQWANADLSNALVIGDNYEAEVIFLVGGFQYITTAMAFNFGYEFRLGWFRNYVFVILSTAFAFIHLYITLVPGELSCVFRVNCENENVVKGVTLEPVPIQNDFNTTLMPEEFRRVWWAS
jgi:cation-transporting ATPase 13A3/4/5